MMNNQIMEKFQKCIRDKVAPLFRCKQDFETIKEIGRGGFSTVYKVKNIIDDKNYSLKKLTLYIKSIKNNFSEEVDKVLREAKFLASLDHPNIIRYYNAWLEVKLIDQPQEQIQQQQSQQTQQYQPKQISYPNDEDELMFDSDLLNDDDDEFELQIDFDEESQEELPNKQKSSSLNIKELANQQEQKQEKELEIEIERNSPTFNKILCQPKPLKQSDNIDLQYKRPNFQNFKKTLEKSKTPEPISLPFNSQSPSLNLHSLKSIHLYIQTELCKQSLENYLFQRNKELSKIKQFSSMKFNQLWLGFMKEGIKLAIQLIQALKYIHQNCKLVHRDIKPSNIFLTDDKVLKVGDFGLVKKLEEFQTPQREFSFNTIQLQKSIVNSSGSTASTTENYPFPSNNNNNNNNSRPCGTLTYAAPEQIDTTNQTFDQRADIYSLAFVFIQLFYPMKTQMEITKILSECRKNEQVPLQMNNDVSEIAQIVKRMLSQNPKKRPNLKEISLTVRMQEEKLNASNAFNCQVKVNFENQEEWIEKWLKIINGNLYFFRSSQEPKAETLYNICESKIEIYQPENTTNNYNKENFLIQKKNSNTNICNQLSAETFLTKQNLIGIQESIIIIQHPIQLSCIIQGKNDTETLNIFKEILMIYETLNID